MYFVSREVTDLDANATIGYADRYTDRARAESAVDGIIATFIRAGWDVVEWPSSYDVTLSDGPSVTARIFLLEVE
jgi:hypothetical protein